MKEGFKKIEIKQIPREENGYANSLANLSSVVQVTKPKFIPIIYLKWPVVWKQDKEKVSKMTTETT